MSILGFYVKTVENFSNKIIEGVVIEEAEFSQVYLIEDLKGVKHYSDNILSIVSDTDLPLDTLRYINDNIRPKLYFLKSC